ncbi:MAG: HupE/UreJ family protein [Colwellia sp.]|nr:HupE/UreJ family protein [Colwellia sp.]
MSLIKNINRSLLFIITFIIVALTLLIPFELMAHGVDENTRHFLVNNTGVQFIAFMYIGAKHMVTGYDHLLFLIGMIFFLYKSKDVLLYVSMFTLGHSLTLLLGVLWNIPVNAYLIDAIIGLSVVYKGFENLGGFKLILGYSPNPKAAVFIFGLFHGFGLATKLQEFQLPQDGLFINLIAFNLGVEIGQFSALIFIVLAFDFWRKHHSFYQFSTATNTLLMSSGFMLTGYQLTGYFIT